MLESQRRVDIMMTLVKFHCRCLGSLVENNPRNITTLISYPQRQLQYLNPSHVTIYVAFIALEITFLVSMRLTHDSTRDVSESNLWLFVTAILYYWKVKSRSLLHSGINQDCLIHLSQIYCKLAQYFSYDLRFLDITAVYYPKSDRYKYRSYWA